MPRTHARFVATGFDAADDSDVETDEATDAAASDSPDDSWGATAPPPGEPLATWLAHRLEAHGWRVQYRWTTPYGHAFDAAREKRRYDVELRELDHDIGRWLVTAKPRSGLFKRIFRGGSDPTEHALLCAHLHEALALDERVCDVSWHDAEAWEAGERDDGALDPGH